jgi:orotidine-5'-phosphate decarboxylase
MHDLLVFEDPKFVDIGNTVQKQYQGGALRISEWAHIVNASVLAGEGILQAMAKVTVCENFVHKGDRVLIIPVGMTNGGTLATGKYNSTAVELARKYKDFVIGCVAMYGISSIPTESTPDPEDDFVIFATSANNSSKGDVMTIAPAPGGAPAQCAHGQTCP